MKSKDTKHIWNDRTYRCSIDRVFSSGSSIVVLNLVPRRDIARWIISKPLDLLRFFTCTQSMFRNSTQRREMAARGVITKMEFEGESIESRVNRFHPIKRRPFSRFIILRATPFFSSRSNQVAWVSSSASGRLYPRHFPTRLIPVMRNSKVSASEEKERERESGQLSAQNCFTVSPRRFESSIGRMARRGQTPKELHLKL